MKSTDPKDAAPEEVNHYRERSLPRNSRPPEEDRTRAVLQAGLDDAKNKQYNAEQEFQKWQALCVKICKAVDGVERELAASRSTRLKAQCL